MCLFQLSGVSMKVSQKPQKWLLILIAGIIACPSVLKAQRILDSLTANDLLFIHEPHELVLDNGSNIEIDTLYARIVPSVDMETIEDRASCLDLDVPIVINKTVCGFIHFFTVRKRNYTQTMLERKNYYFPIFEYYLKKHNMPDALKYLAIVESGMNFKARSKAGAVGLWQFMPGTGSDFYLAQNQFIDERQNPYLATEAACKFLKYLHGMFNDWELALAAYNCGPGNVMKAMRKTGRRGFWDIYNALPQETRSYVPQFHAVVYSMNFAEEHNIKADLDSIMSTTALDTFSIRKSFDIVKLEEILGLPKQSLHQHNPSLKSRVYPSTSRFPLLVPATHSYILTANLDRFIDSAAVTYIADEKSIARNKTNKNTKYHFARKGDKLEKIAQKYDVEIASLKKWNHLKSDKIIKSVRLKIFINAEKSEEHNVASVPAKPAPATTTSGNSNSEADQNAETHTVSKGEKLYQLAVRYGLTTTSLKKLNQLSSSRINEGQVLSLKTAKTEVPSNSDVLVKAEPKDIKINESQDLRKEYVVKKGDRLFTLAKTLGLQVSQIREWNKLGSDQLKTGQVLLLSQSETFCNEPTDSNLVASLETPVAEENSKSNSSRKNRKKASFAGISKVYLVQKGDTLYSITKKFTKLSIKDLMRLNKLKDKNIKPGQQLILG